MKDMCPNCHVPLDDKGKCPRCPYPSFFGRLYGILAVCIGLLAMYGVAAEIIRTEYLPEIEAKLTEFQVKRSTATNSLDYEVEFPPPTKTVLPLRKVLSLEEKQTLRNLFKQGDLSTLTAEMEALQTQFEKDPLTEGRVMGAFSLFSESVPSSEVPLSAWSEKISESYVPHLVLGLYLAQCGWDSRGYAGSNETTTEQFQRMHKYFARSRVSLQRALDINPRLLPAYICWLGMDAAESNDSHEAELIETGIDLFPRSYQFYATIVQYKAPRWGGSYPLMEAYARKAARHADYDPWMHTLFGAIYLDQILSLEHENPSAWGIDHRYYKALAYGERPSVLTDLGEYCTRVGQGYLAETSFARAIALDEKYVRAYCSRAKKNLRTYDIGAYDSSKYLAKAEADLKIALQFDPESEFVQDLAWLILARIDPVNSPDRYRELLTINGLPLPPPAVATGQLPTPRSATALRIQKRFRLPEGTWPTGLEWYDRSLYFSSCAKNNPGIFRLSDEDGRVLKVMKKDRNRNSRYGGIASDGNLLFYAQNEWRYPCAALSLDELEVQREFKLQRAQLRHVAVSDLAFHGESLYAVSNAIGYAPCAFALFRYSLDGRLLQVYCLPLTFDKPEETGQRTFGLACDGRWLWLSTDKYLLKIDPENGKTRTCYRLPLKKVMGLAWDGRQLWAADAEGEVHTIAVR